MQATQEGTTLTCMRSRASHRSLATFVLAATSGAACGAEHDEVQGTTDAGPSSAGDTPGSDTSTGTSGGSAGTGDGTTNADQSDVTGSSSDTGEQLVCVLGDFQNGSNASLDLSDWPTRPGSDVSIDADCVVGVTEVPVPSQVVHHLSCSDNAGDVHELVLEIDAWNPIRAELLENEAVRLRFSREGGMFWLTIRDSRDELRVVVIHASDLQFAGDSQAYAPFMISAETGLCEIQGLCGDERAGILIDFEAGSLLIFDHMTASFDVAKGATYITTANVISLVNHPENCAFPDNPPFHVEMIIAKTGSS